MTTYAVFDRNANGAPAVVPDRFSWFAALLLWLYYSAQIFLFGAEFTACLGQSRTPKPLAAPNV